MWLLLAIGRVCEFESGRAFDDMLSRYERNSYPSITEKSCVVEERQCAYWTKIEKHRGSRNLKLQ
jgi:hypothetical protein